MCHQIQVTVELGGLVGLEHRLHGDEEPRRVAHERGEDELETGVVVLRHHEQRLCVPAQPGVHQLNADVRHAVEPDREVRARRLRRGPENS